MDNDRGFENSMENLIYSVAPVDAQCKLRGFNTEQFRRLIAMCAEIQDRVARSQRTLGFLTILASESDETTRADIEQVGNLVDILGGLQVALNHLRTWAGNTLSEQVEVNDKETKS